MLTTCVIIRTFQELYNEARPPGTEPEEPEELSEEALAKAKADYENRWADCESSDDSPPSSESGKGENSEEEGPVVEGSTVESRSPQSEAQNRDRGSGH